MSESTASRALWATWLPSVLLTIAATHELLYNHSALWEWLPAELLIWLLVLRRRAPELVLAAVLALAVTGWLQDDLLVAHLGVLVALFEVGARRSRQVAAAAAGVVEIAAIGAGIRFAPSGSANDAVVVLSGLTLTAFMLGTMRQTQRRYLFDLEDRAQRLQVDRDQKALIAAAEERARIAREIHDIVAHSVSVMVVMSEAAAAGGDLPGAQGSMRQVAATGREALAELRRVLSVLNEPADGSLAPQPSLAALPALARDVELAGVQVDLDVDVMIEELPDGLQATIFRIVQESLTNTLKHAVSPTGCHVMVAVSDEQVIVQVQDDGRPGAAGRVPETDVRLRTGNGLRGMSERAGLYAGSVTAGATDRGWVVRCVLDRSERSVRDPSPAR